MPTESEIKVYKKTAFGSHCRMAKEWITLGLIDIIAYKGRHISLIADEFAYHLH